MSGTIAAALAYTVMPVNKPQRITRTIEIRITHLPSPAIETIVACSLGQTRRTTDGSLTIASPAATLLPVYALSWLEPK